MGLFSKDIKTMDDLFLRLGRSDVAKVLEQTLSEEKAADKKLTDIAESKVNLKAA